MARERMNGRRCGASSEVTRTQSPVPWLLMAKGELGASPHLNFLSSQWRWLSPRSRPGTTVRIRDRRACGSCGEVEGEDAGRKAGQALKLGSRQDPRGGDVGQKIL